MIYVYDLTMSWCQNSKISKMEITHTNKISKMQILWCMGSQCVKFKGALLEFYTTPQICILWAVDSLINCNISELWQLKSLWDGTQIAAGKLCQYCFYWWSASLRRQLTSNYDIGQVRTCVCLSQWNTNHICLFCVDAVKLKHLSRARLTKAYDVTIQRYRNSHAKIEDSKMHILRCMSSKFCVKFQRCPLKLGGGGGGGLQRASNAECWCVLVTNRNKP